MVLGRYLQIKEGKAYQFQILVESKSDDQLWTSPVASRALNQFQNQVLAVAQLRVMVIAILRYLPEFDPGDLHSKEDERWLEFDFDEVLAIFGRIWMGFDSGLKREVDGTVPLSLGPPLTKPDCLLRVLTVAVRARKLVRHRFCTVIQLPVVMTVISRHIQTLNGFGLLLRFIEGDIWAKKIGDLGFN
ncbi:hypothetical protein Dsin_024012 [Dipteronia sinensis]|uniref:Uncharacterized protein n=1 Tax=Dipteronia sinensis TaxID=43782 RepID=A0AAE0A566_9ROSI|nr:hypothetical protein Dsin_024012 [Dipteronia sinensis]